MHKQTLSRFGITFLLMIGAFWVARQLDHTLAARSAAAGPTQVQGGLIPRFIDFDIGAATVRSGATHQDVIPDIPPYVLFPSAGFPLTIVDFTVPPDFATGGNFDARLVWSAYSANTFPCFVVLRTELVGYGPNHSAALFNPYWAGSGSSNDEFIVQVDNSSIQELLVTFQSSSGFPAYPGDIVTFTLWRDADDINDTCDDIFVIRSISFTYQGLSAFLPYTEKSP